MNIKEFANFRIENDYVTVGGGKKIYFFRIQPPNLSIMKSSERDNLITKLQGLLNGADERTKFSVFATDKLEDLNDNRRFFENLQCSQELEFMRGAIINQIDSLQRKGASIHRAFYIILRASQDYEATDFETQLDVNGFVFHRAERQEISNLLRNYYLHEYVDFDLFAFDQAITDAYSTESSAQKKKTSREAYIGNALTKRLTPRRITFSIDKIIQSDFQRRILIVKNFPDMITVRCALAELFKLKGTSISMQLWQMSESQLNSMVDKQLKNKHTGFFSSNKSKAIKAGGEYERITDFYRNLNTNGSNKVYFINIYIEITAPNERRLKELTAKVKSVCLRCGITLEQLTYEQKEGFFAVNPLHTKTYFQDSANNLPSSTLAWLYPFDYSSHNDIRGIPLGSTIDGGDMFIDFTKRDSFVTNGHFIITGETGYGKSHLLKKIISMLHFCGVGVFCLSPNNEYSQMFRALGGTVIDCAQGRVKINPFDIRKLVDSEDAASDIDAFRQCAAYWQHLSWLRDFFSILFPKVSREELDSLIFYTKRAYAKRSITESTDISRLTADDYPTFTDLYNAIKKSYENSENCLVPIEVRKSLLLLCDDAANGSLSLLFNGTTNIQNADFIVFELQSLLAGSKDRSQAMIFNIMSWIWNRITARERFYLFAIDELYMLVNKHNPVIVRYCNEFVKQFRKFKGIMGMATQQVNDVLDSDIVHETASLFNSPAHKFLLNPGQLDMHELIRILQLTAGEKECMEKLRRGECLYKRSNEASYHVRIDKLPYEDGLFGSGGDG